MTTDIRHNNAAVLEAELDWFYRLLDIRIRLHFGHESSYQEIDELQPPTLDGEGSLYGSFIDHYQLSPAERAVFLLALAPHVSPQLLDVFLATSADNPRGFTEFGGRAGQGFSGFLPTGDTALFLLAGDRLERRLAYRELFDQEHFFARHGILTLEGAAAGEPELSGLLTLSREILDLVISGRVRQPVFGAEFPARRIATSLDWRELVLDPHTREQLLEIKSWIEHGDRVLGELGLGRKLKPGYRSLFFGPPGTGKTLSAALLGQATGRDVYRIDLSLVVSKYVGETEKNLEKVFRGAENQQWILFFDEADALFGKRTAVSDANDRYANQVVSYLLQRLEDYAGVVILASNLRSNLDEAFTRRFQSIIHFPLPKPSDRERLWRGAFSEKTEMSGDVNFREIAAAYELSGGAIMNVVRYATLMAAKRQSTIINGGDIAEGIRKEFQKEGRTA